MLKVTKLEKRFIALLATGFGLMVISDQQPVSANVTPQPVEINQGFQHRTVGYAKKYVSLTFDDGPSPSLTPKLLKILKKYNVPATFFEVGYMVKASPATSRLVLKYGHTIGNHSWNHPDLANMSLSAAKSQISRTDKAIYKATGVKPKYIRPPYGAITHTEIKAFNRPIIQWNVDSLDWSYLNAAKTANHVVATTHGRSIILMHDIHKTSIQAVPSIINRLRAKGYVFVPLDKQFNNNLKPGYQYFGYGDYRK
ncbi:polysaccharide deacetylase [Secundilactobacillus oryzae JCM 18671]|uniref:Polysaccharide deacetylase n=1 Tax=Secundilactobacillus oryzae JCM 18671 TaxID=1291743 RepID=A0A081BHF5_9LACO|nr:polysaccharide deacetylase family protein [Secundilactobacillus oryzae]GAK47473.1 polysaccharide deacetylase [Secundilactobacillus oryzae JCM 18671]